MSADTPGAYNIADLREIDRTLALLGCTSVGALTRDHIAFAPGRAWNR